jgi:hypothetical protein
LRIADGGDSLREAAMHIHFDPLRSGLIALACSSIIGWNSPAFADPLVPTLQSCTTLNCGSLALPGRINAHPPNPKLANSWVGQFPGHAASCLRFQVVTENRDLAMTVVAPNGTVFTNDNGGVAACTACPRVVVAATTNGFYTLVVSNKGGVGLESSFQLRVGLYNSGNAPNCNAPTIGK